MDAEDLRAAVTRRRSALKAGAAPDTMDTASFETFPGS